VRSRGRLRLFWVLIATGIAFWFIYQLFWTYFEVWLHIDVPDLCAADMILFLHFVPPLAALALRPHAPQDEYAARLRRLDFALMMVWWTYLYIFIVTAWQYVVPDIAAYNNNLNGLYVIEKLAFLGALVLVWRGSRGGWKTLYASLFGASLSYAVISYVANWAINRHIYYTGSLIDIPLAVSMAWITIIGLWTPNLEPEASTPSTSTSHGIWLARLGMIAVFSLPLFGAWALLDNALPARIRAFRLVLTLAAALLMGIMVFIRQRLLDRELLLLLTYSRESFTKLKHLQTQITESEKLASIGHFVGGAAHELNNPIAAMLGYSDLLLSTPLSPEQQNFAKRIGQHIRRTTSLVASLLSFAKQAPAVMAPVDLNAVLWTAVKLSQPQWETLNIDVRPELQADLPQVLGDSNQLLQVCVQILNSALHAVDQYGGRTLRIVAEHKDGAVIINFCYPGPGAVQQGTVAPGDSDPLSSQPLSGLGLSACQGILRQHHGEIIWQQDGSAGTRVRVALPVMPAAPEKSSRVLPAWQPQPFA